MSRKIVTAQPKFTMLVANLKGGSDPSRGKAGNPVKARTGFTQQHFPEIQRLGNDRGAEPDHSMPGVGTKMGLVDYTASPVPVPGTLALTVADNDFTAPAHLQIGQFMLISGEHYTPGGTTALTAVAIAATINALPGFSAPVPGGSVVTVSGPAGPGGNDIIVDVIYEGAVANFTFAPDDGTFGSAEPTIGPPDILP